MGTIFRICYDRAHYDTGLSVGVSAAYLNLLPADDPGFPHISVSRGNILYRQMYACHKYDLLSPVKGIRIKFFVLSPESQLL